MKSKCNTEKVEESHMSQKRKRHSILFNKAIWCITFYCGNFKSVTYKNISDI